MKLTNSGFQRGYNPIVVEGDASDMNMDFGELLMEKGDTVSYNEPKECIYVLVTGKVTFRWADKEVLPHKHLCAAQGFQDPGSSLRFLPRNVR